jgi:outer membrane protein assembly factor BamB
MHTLSGCAMSGGVMSSEAAPPRSAQYDIAIDWTFPLNPKTTFYLGAKPLELGHIAVTDNVTYIGSSLSKVVAIHNQKATKIWETALGAPVTAGPVVTSSGVYVALGDGAILKLDVSNGAIVWRYDTLVPIENSIAVQDGVVACVNGNNRLVVLNEKDGTVKWRRERPRSSEFTMYGQSSPLIQDDVLYAGFSDGNLTAFALENGTVIWTRDLAPDARFKDLDVQPVIMDNTLYVANSSGGIYALSVSDGHTLWQRDIHGASSIVPHQDSLYLTSQDGVFRIDRMSGNTIWQNEIRRDALISPMQLGRNYIYASVQRFGLVLIDRATGETAHIIDMGTDFTSAPVLTNGILTALSNRSTVYRLFVQDYPL